MKRVLVLLLLLGGVTALVLLPQEPPIHAQDESSTVDSDLKMRVAKLEELVSFHSHENELNRISARLDAIDAALAKSTPSRPIPTTRLNERPSAKNDVGELLREVQSLKGRLAKLERITSQLKKDDSNLRTDLSRLESTVIRIDLKR